MAQAAMKQDATNQPTISDDAVDTVNLSRIRAAQDAFASVNGSMRSTYAKAEQQGLHLAAAKRALRVVKSGKRDELIEEIQKTLFYLKLLRQGAQESQISMFEFEPSLVPIDEKAGLDGRAWGLDGGDENASPHDLSTAAGQAWLAACRQGRVERDLILSMKDDNGLDADGDQD